MRYSDNYELNLVEGSDIVNPLVQDVPNYETIDDAMFDNKEHSVGVATELKTGTVHSLTRQNEDAAVFRFTATSDYTVGDTFEVDGVQISALLLDGTTLSNRCYIIGSEVLATLKGTLLTVYANRNTASDSDRLGGQLPAYYATDADLDALEDVIEAHTDQITKLNNDLTVKVGAYTTTVTSNASGLLTIPFESDPQTVLMNIIPLNSGDAYVARLNYNTQNQAIYAILTNYAGNNIPNGTVTVSIVYGKKPYHN